MQGWIGHQNLSKLSKSTSKSVCWNLAANTCNHRTNVPAVYQYSWVKSVLVSLKRGGIKARTLIDQIELQQVPLHPTLNAPPPTPRCQHHGPGLQDFRFGWLVFLLIKTEKWLETDWVHGLHHRWWKICFLSSVFLVEQGQMTENISRKQASYQPVLVYVACFHEECCIPWSWITWWVGGFTITVPQRRKGRGREYALRTWSQVY